MSIFLRTLPLVVLAACGAIVPGTALKVARLDPLTADPAGLAAFATLPDGAGLQASGHVLTLSGVRDDDGTRSEGAYALEPWEGGLRIARNRLDELRAQQSLLRDWKAGPGVAGSLSIALAPCVTGAGPAPDARIDVDIMLEEGGPRLPLLRGAPLADVPLGDLPPCDD